ncbi:hypothetical protein [Flavobacterium sp. GSB-24]|uniref:hypothetical protein n=1 Tax=Flavobacterium sp. GSB-24 TaxID=2994319 RepID=UPI002491C2CE|nr:hypothetical protein [Flavobacterium sp. GSB-24]BDU24960.1 hypothetical protein FLGSB24_17040 [Flavobacterium sp. GSB-24]
MIENVLKNLVYTFYPKNISFEKEREKYIASTEYTNLATILNKFEKEYKEVFSKKILSEFQNDYTLKNFQDFTLFNYGDKCMTFNFTYIENGQLYTVSLLISVIIPYYAIKVQKNIIELFHSENRIAEIEKANNEVRTLKEIIIDLEQIVESRFLYNKFPNEMLNIIVDDICFQEAGFGYFKLFNAFFNNLIMNENEK